MKNLILQQIKLLKEKSKNKAERQKSKDDILSDKSSISVKSSKTQSTIIRSGLNLFKGISFCFPIANIDLSPKRIDIIAKTIEAEDGRVVKFYDKVIDQQIDYLLVSLNTKIQLILKKVQNKIRFRQILDFNFVLNSVRQGIVLSIANFSLYKHHNQYDEQKTVTMPLPKTNKKSKLQDEHKFNYFTQILDQKVDTYTDDEFQGYLQNKPAQTLSEKGQKINLIQSCKRLLKDRQKPKPYAINKDTFLCQKSITQETIQKFSMNKFVCEELMKLQKIYENQKDIGRKIAYLKAVSAIKSLNFEIQTEADLQNVRGIGKKIIDKVKELIRTGRLQKLQRLKACEKNKLETDFCKIWGVGPSKAQQLFKQGIKSIEQLKNRTDLLNKNQRLGLKYYQDFQVKIPRQKITRIFELVKKIFSTLVDSIDNYNIQVCGSYRRGKQLCGDIDIIICRKDGFYQRKILLDFILELQRKSFLIDHLQFPSSTEARSSLSYMGVCKFENEIHHRIDIKYYPFQQYAFALLYFTGSDMFNRSMRLYARKVGLQLSDHGSYPRRDERSGAIWEKPIPYCECQKDIFDFMGLDYKSPREREV